MRIEWSFDDGLREDLIIADLFRRYKIFNVTFYIPSNTELTRGEIFDLSRDFEIGGHTVSHFQDMKLLGKDLLKREIEDNKQWLEEIIGRKITKFCYPRGRYDARVMKAVEKAGYTEARTTQVLSTDLGGFNKHTTVHFYPRAEYRIERKNPFEIAKFYITSGKDFEIIRLWGHSRELIEHDYLDDFEALLQFINKQ